MKTLIQKAVWCLPLGALLGFVAYLLRTFFPALVTVPHHAMDDHAFSIAGILHSGFRLTSGILDFAGMLALIAYIVLRTDLVQAKYALVFFFISNCTTFWLSGANNFMPQGETYKSLIAMKTNQPVADLMYNYGSALMITGIVGGLSALIAFTLFLYCLFQTKLFANWVKWGFVASLGITLLTMILVPVMLRYNFHSPFLKGTLSIVNHILMLAVYYGFASQTNFPEEGGQPTVSHEPLTATS